MQSLLLWTSGDTFSTSASSVEVAERGLEVVQVSAA